MSYECNKIVKYLSRNSVYKQLSKSSKSVYYQIGDITVRYSDHITYFPRPGQIQVVRKVSGVWILVPWLEREYQYFPERDGFYFLRRIFKDLKKKRDRERKTRSKRYIKSALGNLRCLKGMSIEEIKKTV